MDLRKIKHARTDRKISIQDVAKQVGISRFLVSRIENGSGVASFDKVVKLAQAVGLEITFKNY